MKKDNRIVTTIKPLVIMSSLVCTLALHGCGSSEFAGKSTTAADQKILTADTKPAASADPSGSEATQPSQKKAGANATPVGSTPTGQVTSGGTCSKVYKQVGQLSCTGFNPSIGVPNGIRRFDFRGSIVTGSIDAFDPTVPIGAGGTTSAALILDSKEQQGDVSSYKIKGTVNWGIYPMGTGSFDFSCLPNGDLTVVEYETAVGLSRTCSYKMSPVSDSSGA